MNRKKRILFSLFLMLTVSLSPAIPSTIPFNGLAATAEAHHHGSHHTRKARTVYITQNGKYYHTHECGNGTYYTCTLKKAKSCHLRPCKKCF